MDVIFISGGKGGVGKSFVAACVAALLDRAQVEHFIVDADFRTGDVAARYADRAIKVDLAAERGWNTLADLIASGAASTAIVNMGADVSAVDRRYAADAARIFTSLGRITLVWVLTASGESLKHLADSVQAGAMATPDARRVIALNLIDDSVSRADFSLYDDSAARKTLAAGGAVEVVIPHLHRDYVAALRDKPLSRALDSRIDGLNLFGCMRTRKWFDAMAAELGPALGIAAADKAAGKADGKRIR